MSPIPTLGEISLTKFTSPEETTRVLGGVVPGQTTASEIESALASAGQPEPLWNDLLAYDPPVVRDNERAGQQVAVDNELLQSCRDKRDDQFLLLWIGLNLADSRLDSIVRDLLTDSDGHLIPEMVNATRLRPALEQRAGADAGSTGDKVKSNVLSLLERCRLLVPTKHGGSIVGIERQLPTAHAVPAAARLIRERLGDRGFHGLPNQEVELALSIGANAWLNLSPSEFRRAYVNPAGPAKPQSQRAAVPSDLVELAAQLRRKGQVVLEGPPGAGKTYVARKYVAWATGDRMEESRLQAIIDSLPENQRSVESIADEVVRRGLASVWDIVQFHPGYDYTDFVRALVAKPHSNGVTFVAQHRILSLIAAVGRELERRSFVAELVLILDEINRGDIPNIFGELLYALEYRNEAVATPYAVDGEGSLTIPPSLRVVGTMNTADRSIAVIDYALRRRFTFLQVEASDAPIRSFAFDDEDTRSAALYLFDRTRQALSSLSSGSRGLQAGPSYFLVDAEGADSSLEVLASRYVYEVLPLLTEYELEGEVDTGAIAALRQGLALSDDAAQRVLSEELVRHLTSKPWEAPTTATAPITSTAPLDALS